ncbi:hypothetical protein ABZW30_21225 [Kitasatospora sp. NPDC004669]|uniref:hypothetical protein n=1 Tax=Kitasatospora sp. NPDC004669 TaxID=3154555 RepID=UPI0033AF6AC8
MAEHEQEPRPERRAPSPTAAESFAGELRTLRLDAGQPSFRTMAKTAGSISHTTLYEAACGSRLPSWATTRAFVQACGGNEEEWQRRWSAAVNGEPAADPALPAPPVAPVAPAPRPRPSAPPPEPSPPSTSPARSHPNHRQLWTHALSLLLGLVIGVLGTLGLLALRAPAARSDAHSCPAADPDTPAPVPVPEPQQTAEGGTPSTAARPWIARAAYDQQTASSTEVALPVRVQVASGDTLVVSMMLTGTCPGPVKVTDSHGDRFQLLGDVTDSLRHRVLVLAAFDASALTTADSIHADYPRAGQYHVTVDEFRGVTTVRAVTRASGDAGGTTFTTTANAVTCDPGDLLVSAVGSDTGTAPEFDGGWTTPPVLRLSSYRLTTAHRIAADADHCIATGRTTSQWGVVLAVLR